MTDPNNFDSIIVGGSYAGLSAAMALGCALRSVLIIDNGFPCNKQTRTHTNILGENIKDNFSLLKNIKNRLLKQNFTLVKNLKQNKYVKGKKVF